MTQKVINVIGAGPAGSAAALAALAEGPPVTLFEKSRFPRHKVCGEFLSPEILPILQSLHLDSAFLAARPARLSRAILRIGRRQKLVRLPEPAYSLSRYALDRLLLDAAQSRGASLIPESWSAAEKLRDPIGNPVIVAHGRQGQAPKGGRLFGFKAHFRGPVEEAVEMFFFRGGYVGVSPVENGAVNVCGLAPEDLLRPSNFQPEAIFPQDLRDRLRPLDQVFDWLVTGPLIFHQEFDRPSEVYLTGDALGFVDPFTGSGILSGVLTGRLAGQAAARGVPIPTYNAECRRILGRQYGVAALARRALGTDVLAQVLLAAASWMPGPLLYRLTRPETTSP